MLYETQHNLAYREAQRARGYWTVLLHGMATTDIAGDCPDAIMKGSEIMTLPQPHFDKTNAAVATDLPQIFIHIQELQKCLARGQRS